MIANRFVLLATLAAALVAVLPAGAARTTPPIASVQGAIRSFAGGPDRVAWIDATWRLHVLHLASGRLTTVEYTDRRDVNMNDPYAEEPALAFAGSRPLWADARGTPRIVETVFSTDDAGRRRPLARLSHPDSATGGTGGYLLSLSGDASGGVFSWGHETVRSQSNRTTAGGVWTVAHAVARRVPGLPPAFSLARSGSRIAFVPTNPLGDSIPQPEAEMGTPPVEIATVGGRVLARFRAKFDVQALALTPRYLFVDVSNENGGGGGLEIHSAQTGALLHWLPGKGGYRLTASGRYALYAGSNTAWLVDGATGTITRVVKAAGLAHAALVGRTIWWTETREAPGSHGDENDPADYVSFIRRAPLG